MSMDAPKQARKLDRNRSANPSQRQRGDRQIVIPMTREQFEESWHDSVKIREIVDRMMVEAPELFPACLLDGYGFHGMARSSKKLDGIRLRKIRPTGGSEAYHLRPSFVMSFMTGITDDVEYPLLLASFGVPAWVLTLGFGHNDMYWHRLVERLGRNSLVGTTVRDPERLPEDLAADEHHADWNGETGCLRRLCNRSTRSESRIYAQNRQHGWLGGDPKCLQDMFFRHCRDSLFSAWVSEDS
jgi:hypothetical protein